MQRSYLISLIVGAVVVVGGAILYFALQTPAPEQEIQASSPADATQEDSGASGAESMAESAEADKESATANGSQGQEPSAEPAPTESATSASATAEVSAGSQDGTEREAAGAPASTQTAATSQSSGVSTQQDAPDANAPVSPSFDVVRVEPSGDTVIAGRAAPGSKVTVLDNGKPLGSVTADSRGEWVFLSEKPLDPGSRELSLESEDSTGLKIPSEDVVVMSVPEKKAAESGTAQGETEQQAPALAVLSPRTGGGGSQILQAPQGEGIAEGELVLEAVDYGENGEVTISGRAAPGSTLRLYLDNELLGETKPDDRGRWSYRLAENLPLGVYQLRADQVNEQGEVLARVETPFSRVEFARAELPAEKFVIVQPGNSLWRIARGTLGEGVRYSVIYQANQDQIRDPDLIYPGQIFMVPQTN
ncbi:MAG: LysM peptidoglycan-binding domain-containing protein [Rhodovibrionaceae bacterium]